jgi:hypothetical protein
MLGDLCEGAVTMRAAGLSLIVLGGLCLPIRAAAEPKVVGPGYTGGVVILDRIANAAMGHLAYQPQSGRGPERLLVYIRAAHPSPISSTGPDTGLYTVNPTRKRMDLLAVPEVDAGDTMDVATDPTTGRIVMQDSTAFAADPAVPPPTFALFTYEGGFLGRSSLPHAAGQQYVERFAMTFDPTGAFTSLQVRCSHEVDFFCQDGHDVWEQYLYRHAAPFFGGGSDAEWELVYTFNPRSDGGHRVDRIRSVVYAEPTAENPHGTRIFAVSQRAAIVDPTAPQFEWDALIELKSAGGAATLWEDPTSPREFFQPRGLAVHPTSKEIFFASGRQVLKIDKNTNQPVPMIVGFGEVGGIAFDSTGRLYVTDQRSGPLPDCGPVELPNCGLGTLWRFPFDDGYRLKGAVSIDLFPNEETVRVTKDSRVTVQSPLGGPFYLRLIKLDPDGKTERPIVATFSLKDEQAASFPPLDYGNPLFSAKVAIQFDDKLANETHPYQAIHIGDATIAVDSAANDDPDFDVHLAVYANEPGGLGDHREIDDIITDLANRRGIPPQIIKGQITQEGAGTGRPWDPFTYRYEPVSIDANEFSPSQLGVECYPGGQKNLRNVDPYRPFALGMGQQELPADRAARTHGAAGGYRVLKPDGPTAVRITGSADDDAITAGNIVLNNDGLQHWVVKKSGAPVYNHTKKKPLGPCVLNYLAAHENEVSPSQFPGLEFNAQTTLASSFGYLQVLYVTAISERHWRGALMDDGTRALNPSYLFDLPENLRRGGGSLVLGTGLTTTNYVATHGKSASQDAKFKSYAAFRDSYIKPLGMYNLGSPDYGPGAITNSADFVPVVVTRTIFQ